MTTFFTLKELCASRVAAERNIDNFPTFEIAEHLKELTENLLDPLRIAWGGPIRVTSGYRCPKLNTAVGGAYRSVHQIGYAADLQPVKGNTEDFIKFVKTWVTIYTVRFDQLIRETDGNSLWLHFGLYSPDGAQRGQILNLTKK